ncbi:type IX secretion system membrane protein PorP/SprF [Pedobacter sp. SD-b]|uniref:Type IX secretion system membrane protein PorP/SprF n=1 Tax=Pedobacter segetis TaxID=2793069 RepID=A0ABS1BGC2_9SPHI|nr:type IX secretion system membrane protein PorP/SprF [Pedobacter segetis]MBK0381880.1 type IX secretion system membrane protein PorP/SprF [Pedobacter segetis]
MIKIKKSLLVGFALLASTFYAEAQQDAQYSQYMFNSLVINPAYAGYKGTLNASGLYRIQYVDVPGGPVTQSIVLDGSFFDDKVGLGLTVVKDKIGLQEQSSAFLNFAYKLTVGDGATLAFGLGAGVGQYKYNGGQAEYDDPNDPTLGLGTASYISPDLRAGIHYSTDKFYAGLSSTNLISSFINNGSTAKDEIVKQGRHIFLTAGYLLDFGSFVKYKPSFLIKEDTKAPTNLDINNFFLFGEKVWLGVSYRTSVNVFKKGTVGNVKYSDALVGLIEIYASPGVRIGYAYDHSLNALKGFDNGSHEISLGITFGPKARPVILSPRYF